MPAALLLLSAALVLQSGGVETFADKAGGFEAHFPLKPQASEQKVTSPAGEISVHMFIAETSDGAYFVSYNDYPQFDPKQAEAVLDGSANGSVTIVNGTVVSKTDITLGVGKIRGKEVNLTLPLGDKSESKGKARTRMYLLGPRLYQVLVVGTEKSFDDKKANAFLDSFKITKKAP